MDTPLNRRQALTAFGSVSLTALLAACGSGDDAATTSTGVTTTGGATATVSPQTRTGSELARRFDDAATCARTPELTDGPYYFDADAIRSDIREDREGTTLRLGLRVREATRCKPIPNAVVDIWHCDAGGSYSGFESAEGERYLRGAQVTNGDGIVEFVTIYPGWYPGRTVHIHAKVHLDRQTVLTTQLFFDDGVSSNVYASEPYTSRGRPDQRNESDGIFDESLVLTLSRDGDGYLGLMTLDVEARTAAG